MKRINHILTICLFFKYTFFFLNQIFLAFKCFLLDNFDPGDKMIESIRRHPGNKKY